MLARLGRCPSQCERSELGLRDLSKPTTLLKSKFRSILRFGILVLWYLTLVGHNQSQVRHTQSLVRRTQSTHVVSYIKFSLLLKVYFKTGAVNLFYWRTEKLLQKP